MTEVAVSDKAVFIFSKSGAKILLTRKEFDYIVELVGDFDKAMKGKDDEN